MSGYPRQLIYFMWSWQVHFMINCKVQAEGIFAKLDRGLNPNVFLIGIDQEQREDRMPVCVEPEDLKYSVDEFSGVEELAQRLYFEDPDKNMMYSGAGMQEEMDARRMRRSFRLAIEKILNESSSNAGTICFASEEALIGGYWVYVVLELDKSIYESHIHLKKHEERIRMCYSLVEAAKDAFLKDRYLTMHLPDAGKYSSDNRHYDEFLREAANNFMHTISWKSGNHNGRFFDLCNELSTARYEGSENFGELIIASEKHKDVEMIVEVEEPFELNNFRKIRKLLQLTDGDVSIVSNSSLVYGIGRILPSYDPVNESIYRIKFQGTHCWDLFHGEQCLMQMKYGVPQFKSETISKLKFESDAKRIFDGITADRIDRLHGLASAIAQESRGAQLIISADAGAEAERLKAQCIKVQPVPLTIELFHSLSLMDGGILIDLDGTIFAAGVILDGIASTKGNSARGSRYNSAVRYYEHYKNQKPTMIIVISEDGMVDRIPDLRPQVKHSEILFLINALRQICNEQDFDRVFFYQAMDLVRARRFYLTEDECTVVNALRTNLENLDRRCSDHTMWRTFGDVVHNKDMDDSYYLPEPES